MLRLFGTPRTLCDGLTRRDLLQIGSLGMLGLSLDGALRLAAARASEAPSAEARTRGFGRAKSCILLFPYGSPPQHETFDPKPNAPAEIQGELKDIATSVPGLRIGELLPRVAQVMDRVTVVRSMTHPFPVHGVAYAVTGLPSYTPDLELRPRDPKHWPFIGSIVDYLDERRTGERAPALPRNVGLPWLMTSKTDLGPLAGPYAAFLGQAYDPVWTDFTAAGTKIAPRNTQNQKKEYLDPHMGVTPDARFQLSPAAIVPEHLGLERLGMRRSLLAQFDHSREWADASQPRTADKFRQMAWSLLSSNKLREAIDIGHEPLALRESYGMTLFGQACLAARRLVETGCRFVSVFWDCYGEFANGAWDTHTYHYPRLKQCLLPGFDLAFSGLIRDLDDRGMLDDTLVVCMSEHGRTPKLDSKLPGAGRDHWSRVYSAVLAGGGVPRGKIVGASDRLGGDVLDTPVSPKDVLATTYHLLGIDPHATVPDQQGRPHPVAGNDAQVRSELLT